MKGSIRHKQIGRVLDSIVLASVDRAYFREEMKRGENQRKMNRICEKEFRGSSMRLGEQE